MVVAAILMTACRGPITSPSAAPGKTPGQGSPGIEPSTTSGPAASVAFTIGAEYALLGLAGEYAAAGIDYAKLQDAYVIWGNVQPEPGGPFRWGPLDAVVTEYQAAGFDLQMDLTALSPWASSVVPSLTNRGDTFPKPDYLDDYERYVMAVVERYDHDGVDDMPGLRRPIHDYGVEREFSGFWPGTADEYLRLLRVASGAIRAADPAARVLLVGLLLTDVFDGAPGANEAARRLDRKIDYLRKQGPDIRRILAACDDYDVVDFHSLGNYTEIPGTVDWIRRELDADGCGPKPIWIGDAFPMSLLVGYGGLVPATPFAPATADARDAVIAVLKAVADPADPSHAAAQDWLRSQVAIGLTRKIVVAAASGVEGINVGNMEDWRTGLANLDAAAVPGLGAAMFMGLTDTTKSNRRPGGEIPFEGRDWARARDAGSRRPGWHALSLVAARLAGFTAVTRLDLGTGVWAYRFETPAGPSWVLWRDDGLLHLPGDAGPFGPLRLPFDGPRGVVTFTPADPARPDPPAQAIDAVDGFIELDLGAAPAFVQPG